MLEDLLRYKKFKMKYSSSTHKITREELEELKKRVPPDWIKHWRDIGVIEKIEKESRLDFYRIEPGEKLTIFDVNEPGIIASIWMTIKAADRRYLRTTIIRAFWDGEAEPSIEAPIGDFFLQGHRAYNRNPTLADNSYALLLGLSSGGFFCYFPMPFRSARIEVENAGAEEIQALYYIIGYYVDVDVDEMPRFHAIWRRERETKPGKPYLVLDAEGRGHYVGTYLYMRALSLKSPLIGGLGFLEGNVEVLADGEVAYCATGTEDYFLSGWYFAGGVFTAAFHGLVHKDEERGEIAVYRFHIMDPIPFTRSLKVLVPHGEWNDVLADYSSVAYWYQGEPHKTFSRVRREDLY